MGKDRVNNGTQQTRMDQYTAQNPGPSLQKDPPATSEKGTEPTEAQILAAIESSSRATQTQIAAITVDVNLLRADLRAVVERSMATEQKVTCMQSEVDILKASVTTFEAQTHKQEARVLGKWGSGLAFEWGLQQCGESVNPPSIVSLFVGGKCVCGLDDWREVAECSPDRTLAIEWERQLFPTSGH
ncbi:hypothetical protein NDU88_008043 [Pleurodeles waltl]|uniref:Uncharacterized protein n=1 Tax=Pleurodeles waltl TaxID=8319 RepID=A0AAV7PQZ8_PLEWA|nr:hypothetical protein NDU88_008043 [Pleurodeles waltl]